VYSSETNSELHWFSLADFLHKIFNPLAGHKKSFVKNSEHFIEILDRFKIQGADILISFNVVSLFTNVPIIEALQVIRNKLSLDETHPNRSSLQTEDIMELSEVCIKTTYFQVEDRLYQQKSRMAMGSSLSKVVSHILRNILKN
jgi:hypothetical protein